MLQHVPLSFLRVFEAAGRTGSFRAAAVELNLTPSAVSHAIRKLEQALGIALFERNTRNVRLSYEGEALMRHVSRAFDELRRGMDVVSTRGPNLLRLHCAPSFAAQWLTPRLADFLKQHPGVEVRIAAGTDYTRFNTDEFDADIVYGSARVEGLIVVPLGEETIAPMCAPDLAAMIATPSDLFNQVLIQSDSKQIQWADWFAANGLVAPPPNGSRFDRSFIAIAAAAEGLGVALESTRLAERELASGRLVMPLDRRAVAVRYIGHNLVFRAMCGSAIP
jgi:DNA-binding transcriptional LysR family regulator